MQKFRREQQRWHSVPWASSVFLQIFFSITFCLVNPGWTWSLAGSFLSHTPLQMILLLLEIWGESTMKWMACPVITEQRTQFTVSLYVFLPYIHVISKCQLCLTALGTFNWVNYYKHKWSFQCENCQEKVKYLTKKLCFVQCVQCVTYAHIHS